MPKPLNIVQVCRRFGPVGGMERYVWELSHELAKLGHQVHILCEVNLCEEPLADIQIHELGAVHPKPRWLAHMRFSKHVQQWLTQQQTPEMIIHSHERTANHHITTFHGPPFAIVRNLPWWKRLSLRMYMNLWLEKRELCAPQVQAIVPNSMQIAEALSMYYPSIKHKLTAPIIPGVSPLKKRIQHTIAQDAGVIGFIGKEWKRKGLEKAVQIVESLHQTRPNLHFLVAGANQEDIAHLFKHVSFQFELLGSIDVSQFYAQLDVLLHPASNEPYGMVITEALSADVPVVISDVCGAASEVTESLGNTLALHSPAIAWAEQVNLWLMQEEFHADYKHSWQDTALAYEKVYEKISC